MENVSNTNVKIAFFDIDHTIIKRSTSEYFVLESFRHKLIPFHVLFSVPYLLFQYKFLQPSWDEWERQIPCLKGLTKSKLETVCCDAFVHYGKKKLYTTILEIIKNYREEGIPVVLATSSVDMVIKPLADYIGYDDIIASSIEFENGIATGKFDGEPAFSEKKLEKVKNYAKLKSIELKDCVFYSDSIHDYPLLNEVGKPVCVNPDKRLKKVAKDKNWKILQCKL